MKRLVTFSMLAFLLFGFLASETAQAQLTVKAKRVMVGSVSSGPNYVSGALRNIAKGMKAYYTALKTDTGSTQMSTYAWSLSSKPAGSTVTVSATTKDMNFIADTTGVYIVSLTVNGSVTTADTISVGTYVGVNGCLCHYQNQQGWAKTGHAMHFKNGITGKLENDPAVMGGKGVYGQSCIKCHTTGWEPTLNNGNFGYLAHQSTFDSTWWKGLPSSGNSYYITPGDLSIWNSATMTSQMQQVASISCESCHGPGSDHNGNKARIAKSLNADQCNVCHNSSATKHNLGAYWGASQHSKMPNSTIETGGHATSGTCARCHSGAGFVAYTANKSYVGTASDFKDGQNIISCPVCHDPHSADNPNQLRTVKVDTLLNGFVPTTGGKGQLCMNCHQSRSSVAATVLQNSAPLYGFKNNFGPHNGPQTDVFFGKNGYEYGKSLGVQSHAIVTDACVTCHMPTITWGSNVHSNHEFSIDSAGVRGCQTCHSGVKDVASVHTRNQDYDGNGKVEPVQTEVDGLLAQLKAKLPLDPATGEPVNQVKDSLKIKNRPEFVEAIWNYYMVTKDGSHGVHNPQYVIALLKASIGSLTGVETVDQNIPKSFELAQNYPNPFNPSTEIRFSVPTSSYVRLQVYNSIGQLVATLADGNVAPGNYTAKLNGSNLSSGIYLYRLESSSNGKSNFVVTKKMLLVK